MELLKDVIDESILGLTRTMVTREEQDKVRSSPPTEIDLGRLSTKSRLCTVEK